MKIQLNGNPHDLAGEMTVDALLESIGFGGKPCVVELDEEAVFPRDFARVPVRDGARVEVVTLAAGG
jgi:sulfur carrier protein